VKKIVCDKLEEVAVVDFVEILTPYERPFLDSYHLLSCFFR
jgi:hypothetical protein